MSEIHDLYLDQELHQLEVETFEIEDLAEVEQIAGGCSTSCTSSTTSTTSCTSSTAAMQPAQADR